MTRDALPDAELLRLLVDTVRDYAIFVLSPDGHVLTWNPGAQRVKGWTADQIVGRHFSTFYPQADIDAGKPEMELRAATAEGRFEDEGWRLRADGGRFWANVIITALRGPDGELAGFAKITRDLTERRTAEQALAENEQRLREAQRIARMGNWEWRVADDRVIWSEGLFEVYGLNAADFAGSFEDFLRRVHPEDREKTRASVQRALETGGAFEFEERITRGDGAVRVLHSRGHAVIGRTGATEGLVGICIDITERKEAEQRRAQLIREQAAREEAEAQAEELEQMLEELEITNEQLEQRTSEAELARAEAEESNRVKARFLANMSHELRTPLNAIAGYTDLLEGEVQGPINEAQREALRRIQRNQRHLLSLINDLLNFSKLTAGHVQFTVAELALDEVFKDLETLTGPQVQRKGLILSMKSGDRLRARADAEKLLQILLNLMTNAVKFTDAGGRILIEAHAADGRIVIEVADTGCGIPADRLESVFDPFVQVHADGSLGDGAGLGLAIARELARGMGGDLTVRSVVAAGSTFSLTLPAARPAPSNEPAVRS